MRHIILIILIFTTTSIVAQVRLTLEECRALALQNNEEIKIARLEAEKAKAGRDAMKTQYLPSLSGSATGIYLHNKIEMEMNFPTVTPNPVTGEMMPNVMTHPVTGEPVTGADGNPVFNMYGWLPLEISLRGAYLAGISLQQPIYSGGKINAANAMARIGVEMSSENLLLQQAQVTFETDQAFWLYVSVQEKVKLARAYTKLLETLEQRVQDAFETGLSTRNDLLKVIVRHNEARLQLQKAESGLELARMALCRLTGLPFTTEVTITDSLLFAGDAPPVLPGIANPESRPEYRLLQKNTELAERQYRLVKASSLPTAGISVAYNYVGGIEVGTINYHSGNPMMLASLKIPVFHWGEERKKQLSARQDVEIRKTELEKNARLMALEMEQVRLNLSDAATRVGLTGHSLAQAEENLRVNSDNFELGMGVLTDLLEAQAHWQRAHADMIEARAELKIRETAWLKAAGKLN